MGDDKAGRRVRGRYFTQRAPDSNSALDALMSIDTSTLSTPITEIQAQIMIMQAYDEDYNLDTGEFSVCICDEEKLGEGSLIEYWAREYKRCRIWETWHYTLDEFMDRPRSQMQMLCKLGLEDEIRQSTEEEEVKNLLAQKGFKTNL